MEDSTARFSVLRIHEISVEQGFNSATKTKFVYKGDSVKIRCKAKGSGNTKSAMLLINGSPPSTDGQYVIVQTEEVVDLVIPSFSQNDAGDYTCRIKSNTDTTTEATLKLYMKSEFSLPENFASCEDPKYRDFYCLNAGLCYQTKGPVAYSCYCREGYEGKQCQDLITSVYVPTPGPTTMSCPQLQDIQIATFCFSFLAFLLLLGLLMKDLISVIFDRKNKHLNSNISSPVSPNPPNKLSSSPMKCPKCRYMVDLAYPNWPVDFHYTDGPLNKSLPPPLVLSSEAKLLANKHPKMSAPGKHAVHMQSYGSWPRDIFERRLVNSDETQRENADNQKIPFRRSRKLAVSDVGLEDETDALVDKGKLIKSNGAVLAKLRSRSISTEA